MDPHDTGRSDNWLSKEYWQEDDVAPTAMRWVQVGVIVAVLVFAAFFVRSLIS